MKIALLGYGKMGKAIEALAPERGHEVVVTIDDEDDWMDKLDDLRDCDVAIEFSTPATVVGNIMRCFDMDMPIVVGTTGWYDQLESVAHDCQLGSHIILANAVQLAGHVHLDDWVFLGGLTGVHQYGRVGAHAMTAFQTRLAQDVPPFVTAGGNPAHAQTINAEGLRRRGFSTERIAQVRQMYRLLYRRGLTLEEARGAIAALHGKVAEGDADVALMLEFLRASGRGIVR